MGRLEKGIFFTVLFALGVVLLLMVWQSAAQSGAPRAYNISRLVRAPSENFRRGLEQAAIDYNVDIHIVLGYEEGDGALQAKYLAREIGNYADAIILSAEDAGELSAAIDALRPRAPIVTVGEKLASDRVALHVGADDAAIARKLAELIISTARNKRCLLFHTWIIARKHTGYHHKFLISTGRKKLETERI